VDGAIEEVTTGCLAYHNKHTEVLVALVHHDIITKEKGVGPALGHRCNLFGELLLERQLRLLRGQVTVEVLGRDATASILQNKNAVHRWLLQDLRSRHPIAKIEEIESG